MGSAARARVAHSLARGLSPAWGRSGGAGTGGRYPGALQAEGRPMSKISFDGHLIDLIHLAAGMLINGCFQHATATGISFDDYLMAPTGARRATHHPGNRAGVTRYCDVSPSAPGRLVSGDVSGREIQ